MILVHEFQELSRSRKLVQTFNSAACAIAPAPLKVGTKIVLEQFEPNFNESFRLVPEAILNLAALPHRCAPMAVCMYIWNILCSKKKTEWSSADV
jgi:hypothetical protein